MICSKCGKEVNNSDSFCSNCGNELDKKNIVPEGQDNYFKKRVLCSDGNCIGVIGKDGICNICKKPYDENIEKNYFDKKNIKLERTTLKSNKTHRKKQYVTTLMILIFVFIIMYFTINNTDKKKLQPDSKNTNTNVNESTITTPVATVPVDTKLETETDNKIVCDKFDVIAELIEGSPITIKYHLADTDLPDDADVSVYIYMYYWLDGDDKAQAIEYYQQSTTVSDLKNIQTVKIEESILNSEIDKYRRRNILYKLPFNFKKMDDKIDFQILVPLQKNKQFGEYNKNLTGKMVTTASFGIHVIELQRQFTASTQ